MNTLLSGELGLIAACCHWPRGPKRDAAVRAAAGRPLDWSRVERLTARHRVTALVHDGLHDARIAVPADIATTLQSGARKAGQTALAMARETMRLQSAFDAAGIPVLFVKGTTLALLAYGEIGIKQSWDIDLLTTTEQALAGRHLLESAGYFLFLPALDDPAFLRFVALGKEAVFHHPQLGISVELHWRLLDAPYARLGMNAGGPTQNVRIAGADLRTLPDDGLYIYLCIHGAAHAWFRLKWLADLAAFLAYRSPEEVERLHASAVAQGAARPSAASLLLCHIAFAMPLSEALRVGLEGDRWTLMLVRNALYCLRHEVEFAPFSQPGLRTLFSHFLVGGMSDFYQVLGSKWISTTDRIALPLPPRWAFLYSLLRVPSFFWRRLSLLGRRWAR